METLIAAVLANLPAIIKLGETGFNFIAAVRTAAKQTGEWTDAQEAAFQAQLASEAIDPAWQLDPTPAPDAQLAAAAKAVVADATAVVCPTCAAVLTPDSPTNCNCPAPVATA